MTTRTTLLGAVLALAFGTNAFAQRSADAAFTATGASCDEITWSEAALEQYPNIASACQGVMERDGEYYVRFEGEVRRVSERGGRVTIAFEDGDTLTLAPPQNLTLTIDGRTRAPRDLRPGDDLTFYVPEDEVTATFFAGQPETSDPQNVPISAEESSGDLLAQSGGAGSELPTTAGFLPLVGVGGLALLGLGSLLTLWRLRTSSGR